MITMSQRMHKAMPRRSSAVASRASGTLAGTTQATELDRRRIVRALELRGRYRYVTPSVLVEPDGFRIVSPCCSRNIDPEGGTIDIARIEHDAELALWRLYSKNHATLEWLPQAEGRLHEMLDLLKEDPDRVFWQ
jgi:selenocysteine lyase/cysteine desulfurase